MRLYSCYFGGDEWEAMARALRYSATKCCPGWRVDVERIEAPPPGGDPCYVTNTAKLARWRDVVWDSPDGERLALVDTDAMILRDLTPVWDRSFDIAYTVTAPKSRLPFNAGVVFVRVGPGTRDLFMRWYREDDAMMRDRSRHERWRVRFGGINQAALGAIMRDDWPVGLDVVQLPCAEWNCENSTWAAFDPKVTRVVHVKSSLRRSIFGIGASSLALRPLVRIWRELERESKA